MANLLTAGELIVALPEFANVPVPTVDFWITQADEQINSDAWGSRAKLAETYLAAHMLAMAGVLNPQGAAHAAGPVASIKVGEVSVSYTPTALMAIQKLGLDPSLVSTRYGLEYARLVSSMSYGAAVI